MVRQPRRSAARALALVPTLLLLAACGIKGPLVPPKSTTTDTRPAPEATTVPNIPSADPSVNSRPAP
jgi:predicted small lipoprotein YifL